MALALRRAVLARLDDQKTRELVTDAWRMCTPRMLHDLPELPAPAMAAWAALDEGRLDEAATQLHPDVDWSDGRGQLRGWEAVLGHLRGRPAPRPPPSVEVGGCLVRCWVRCWVRRGTGPSGRPGGGS